MYLHEALRTPHCTEFIKAMQAKIGSHRDSEHWKLMPRTNFAKEHQVLNAVWSMKQKHRIITQEVYKWKAQLNVHGG
jgi:hypothetical protein